ncbi:oxidoreductase, NAD-binding Rossmann fold family protein [Lactobacillus selangorensis]|uniref:Oxidoreductase, NAD-binding Rossmann fold family protein n=1 Tax=Lactobacillus selangorensis TaxID=81857 RepID=A0A0R2FGD1_9LACO|nr:Gfo/Idh/MocA family oxidoreductase [Lactobacillus selangorensis]KRN27278.1 oxidoreductase, NAD-binding Rossmann fold family protein [Lactobacillus selangorensis]KRN29939.1 oxidoreductase, NAD-binding Rossmann fold family protein [Lactobacillus selangorensis]
MTKTLKWGIIGLGAQANNFATYFDQPDGVLYGAASRHLDKAELFTQKHHIPHAYGSYAEMLADPAIDIVYIATPHNYHIEWILASLKAGKHVLCEKAITMESKQLNTAITLAHEKHLVLAEAMTIYHMPLFAEIKRQQEKRALGPLKTINVSFGSYKELDPKNRFWNPDLAGGALLDIGVYALSFARYFMSAQLLATQMKRSKSGVDSQSAFLITDEPGEQVTVALNLHAKMPKQGVVTFENGYFTVMDYPRADTAVLTHSDGQSETIEAGDATKALNYEIRDFQEVVRGNQPNDTLQLTQDVMNLMTAARREWHYLYPFENANDLD